MASHSLMSSDRNDGSTLKMNILPGGPPPKRNKEPKTYVFELELGESNEHTYPEFSWAELVRDAKTKEIAEKKKLGGSFLDPFASDDEDDLKAMAAKFEEKYGNQSPTTSTKKKRKIEECIDRGAGYDDNDSFIDNTDAYDERVPQELQPVCGGFYINSGQLDYKEVHISEDEDEDEDMEKESKPPEKPIKKFKNGTPGPPNKISKTGITLNSGEPVRKKRRVSHDTPVSRPKVPGVDKPVNPNELLSSNTDTSGNKPKRVRHALSSSSSSSSSKSGSSSSSSSSNSESSSSSESDGTPVVIAEVKAKSLNSPFPSNLNSSNSSKNLSKQKESESGSITNSGQYDVTIKPTTMPQQRRPKVKNVPLNPTIKRISDGKTTPLPLVRKSLPPATITPKLINPKNLVTNPLNIRNSSITVQSPSPSGGKTSPANFIRVPTPKSAPTSTSSPKGSPATTGGIVQGSNTVELQVLPNPNNSSTNMISKVQKSKNMSAETMAHEILNKFSRAASTPGLHQNQNQNQKTDNKVLSTSTTKPLPKLKHKSGLIIEKQTLNTTATSLNSTGQRNQKPIKLKAKQGTPPSMSMSSISETTAALQAFTNNMVNAFPQYIQHPGPGPASTCGVEITKLKPKPLKGLGAGITVTEVKDKSMGSGQPQLQSNSMLGRLGAGKPPMYPSHTQQIFTTPTTITTGLSSASHSDNAKISQSVTITPSPLMNLPNELSDRFNLNNFMGNKTNKLPGRITSYDVSALLSNSTNASDASRPKTEHSGHNSPNNAPRDRK